MTVATGYRPRRWEEHLRLANALARAPARIAIEHADDGWVAAHLAVCGRAPIWASRADPRPVQRALLRLGLPGLGGGPADAKLSWDLRLRGRGHPQRVAPGAGHDVDIITSVSGPFHAVRDQIRTLQGRGRLIIVDRSEDPAVHALLQRVPRATVLGRPGLPEEDVLHAALGEITHDEVLWVPEGCLLLPGAVAVLLHALRREPGPAVVVGDVLVLDAHSASPVGLDLAPRLPEHRGRHIWAALGDRAWPQLFHASLAADPVQRALAPVRVVPVWTAGALRPQGLGRSRSTEAPNLALVPPDQGLFLIVDDGDEGALSEVLARLPAGARTAVLRAVPDAFDGVHRRDHMMFGGFGDLVGLEIPGSVRLRLSSDPAWSPPPLHHLDWLRRAPESLPSAVVSLAAVLGWPMPVRRRHVGRDRLGAVARLAADARATLDRGDRERGLTLARALVGAAPGWAPVERLLDRADVRLAG